MINKDFILGYGAGKNAAGGGVEVEALSATQNNIYTAPEGKAYSPVTVNVPNTYAAGDEGKVVSSGALVAQTSATYTTNNTYDTTLINSVTVNVSGGEKEVVTGTIYFAERTTIRQDWTITHNLGKAPSGIAWIIENTAAVNNRYIYGSWACGAVYSDSLRKLEFFAGSGDTNQTFSAQYSNSSGWSSRSPNSSTIKIFTIYESGLYVPADTTIRWFVW